MTTSTITLRSILEGILAGDEIARSALCDYITEFGKVLTPDMKRAARLEAGVRWSSMPVELDLYNDTVFAGVAGEGPHYVNKSGERIYYPPAYRAAWGKPIYVPSTRRVVVGPRWVIAHLEKEE